MTTAGRTARWVTCPDPRPDAAVRLFCLPFAGGGASSYRLWSPGLPPWIEVCPIQLPGREERLRETPFTNLIDLSEAVSRELWPCLDKPFALFGHSLGALLAFEVARSLRRGGRPAPLAMYLAAYPAPHLASGRTPIHQLPDPAFIEELRRLQGTPEAVLGNRELIDFLLPVLRADFEVCDTYVCASEPLLACPLYLFGGTDDVEVAAPQLEQWRELTAGAFRLRMLSGTHFFVQSQREQLLAEIGADLARLI